MDRIAFFFFFFFFLFLRFLIIFDVTSNVALQCKKNTGIPFVDLKIGFSLLQTLTYYTSFY